MIGLLLLVGVLVAVFVGFNIGGSSTGVAFGPAVGSDTITKIGAAGLMSAFALLGGWTVGRNVVETMGGKIVPAALFSMEASIAVLFFIGFALFAANLVGVPASTSMTAVGAIAGLGIATGQIDWAVLGRIVAWWLVAPVLAFWASGVVGRYFYPHLVSRLSIDAVDGPLFVFDRSGSIPRPGTGPNVGRRELFGSVLVIGIGCYMAFSAGASNVANAVAPLVGNGSLSMNQGILLAGGAIGLGAFTIARRTLDTVGNDITDLPLTAALVVSFVSASIITVLSLLGIPASFVVVATMSIVGLGWGRATRTARISDAIGGKRPVEVSVGALAADETDADVARIGREDPNTIPSASDLFRPATTARVIVLQNLVPSIATVAAYLLFEFTSLA